jgi:hypothetical protein
MAIGRTLGKIGSLRNSRGYNMTYEYKFIPSSIYAKAQKGANPKQQYIDLFQETLNDQFFNSTNWWVIEEEREIGSQRYQDIDVRITHVINAETGLKLGDDWKTILFQDVNHPMELGKQYRFNNSIWLVVNTEITKNIAATCTIRRCNNTLRWIDEPTGTYYEEPCAVEYMVKEPRDYATQGSPFMTPGGFLHINMQLNERSGKIKENQRFLFGNPNHWTCYKVVGTGINDFRNVDTYDNESANILTLDLSANFVNEQTDDTERGIADVYTNIYEVTLSSGSLQGAPMDTIQLTAYVTYNGDNVYRDINWVSSDDNIASVSASGLVTFNNIGNCIISASMIGNPASDICWITVTASPIINTEILISPNMNYVLEGSSRTYSVYLYENSIQQADSFTITCDSGSVPAANYIFTQTDGNHFMISNVLRDLEHHLTVQCTTGSVVPPKDFYVYLRGAWQFDTR